MIPSNMLNRLKSGDIVAYGQNVVNPETSNSSLRFYSGIVRKIGTDGKKNALTMTDSRFSSDVGNFDDNDYFLFKLNEGMFMHPTSKQIWASDISKVVSFNLSFNEANNPEIDDAISKLTDQFPEIYKNREKYFLNRDSSVSVGQV